MFPETFELENELPTTCHSLLIGFLNLRTKRKWSKLFTVTVSVLQDEKVLEICLTTMQIYLILLK